jgi:predicted PurR-regulated permease PerM
VIIGIITGVILFFVPMLVSEFMKLKTIIFSFVSNGGGELIPNDWESFLKYIISATNIQQLFNQKNILEIARDLFPHAWSILTSSFSVLVSIFIVFIVLLYLFFILKDYDILSEGFISMIPVKQRKFVSELMKDVESGMNRYYRGQAMIAMIVGILFGIGFSIIGLPLAILMGLLLGILNLVPYMQTLSIPITVLLALLRVAENGGSPWWALISLALVYIIVQIIQDGYLVPKIMGKAMGLSSAVILLSLSIWGVLLGVLGLIIALPATTLLIAYYKRFVLSKTNEQMNVD